MKLTNFHLKLSPSSHIYDHQQQHQQSPFPVRDDVGIVRPLQENMISNNYHFSFTYIFVQRMKKGGIYFSKPWTNLAHQEPHSHFAGVQPEVVFKARQQNNNHSHTICFYFQFQHLGAPSTLTVLLPKLTPPCSRRRKTAGHIRPPPPPPLPRQKVSLSNKFMVVIIIRTKFTYKLRILSVAVAGRVWPTPPCKGSLSLSRCIE